MNCWLKSVNLPYRLGTQFSMYFYMLLERADQTHFSRCILYYVTGLFDVLETSTNK